MKKKWLSLLLALALCLGLAAPVMAEETAQTYAYTCDKLLWLGPIPVAGLTVINNEYRRGRLLYCGKCRTPKQFRMESPPLEGRLLPPAAVSRNALAGRRRIVTEAAGLWLAAGA